MLSPTSSLRNAFRTAYAASNFPYTTNIATSPFTSIQGGKTRTIMPKFSSVDAERVYRKEHLALVFRILHRLGFAEGIAGHCSVRDPVQPDTFWVNPQGKSFARMRQSDLIQCRVEDGEIVRGELPVDASAMSIHSQMYKAAGRGKRQEGGSLSEGGVESLVHVHSPYTKAFSALNRTLDMISQDACAFYNQQVLIPFAGGVFNNQEGARIASFVEPHHKVAILQNHGLLSVGRLSIDEAAWWQISFEMCARAQILADSALRTGEQFVFAKEQNILDTRNEIGSSEMGWFCLAAYVEEEEWHSNGEHKL